MGSELKPCPFCGGSNVYEARDYVICNDCGAQGPDEQSGAIGDPAERWSMRAIEALPQQPVAWMYEDKYGSRRVWVMRQSMAYVRAAREFPLYDTPKSPESDLLDEALEALRELGAFTRKHANGLVWKYDDQPVANMVRAVMTKAQDRIKGDKQ